MLKNALIIMPFNLPWDWSADYQRQTCLVLHKKNFIVAYMHQNAHFFLKKRNYEYPQIENIIFFTPKYLLPFRRFVLIEKINQILCLWYIYFRYKSSVQNILWLFDPIFYFFPKFTKLLPKSTSIYDCVDYHWSRSKSETKMIRFNEKKLILNADLFVVNSFTLSEVHKKTRKASMIVPLGFALQEMDTTNHYTKKKNKKVSIGFVGSVDFRIDFNLVKQLIKKNKSWQFIFIGNIEIEQEILQSLFSFPNVKYIPKSTRKVVSWYIQQFDICIIPYNTNLEINKMCYPMKLFEYFYFMKPVISTEIDELRKFRTTVILTNSVQEWERNIKKLINHGWHLKYKKIQKKLALENTWDMKIESINRLLNETYL